MPQIDKFTIGLEFDHDAFKKSTDKINDSLQGFIKNTKSTLGKGFKDSFSTFNDEVMALMRPFGQTAGKEISKGFKDSANQINPEIDAMSAYMQKSFKRAIKGIGAFFSLEMTAKGVGAFMNMGATYGVASQYMNFPVGKLDQFSQTYQRFGGTQDQFMADAYGIQQAINSTTVRSNPVFNGLLAAMGIDPNQLGADASTNLPKALNEIFNAFSKQPKWKAEAFANVMGIKDPVFMNMMMNSSMRDTLMKHVAQNGLLTSGMASSGMSVRGNWLDVEQKYRNTWYSFLEDFTPVLVVLLKGLGLLADTLTAIFHPARINVNKNGLHGTMIGNTMIWGMGTESGISSKMSKSTESGYGAIYGVPGIDSSYESALTNYHGGGATLHVVHHMASSAGTSNHSNIHIGNVHMQPNHNHQDLATALENWVGLAYTYSSPLISN